LTKILKNQLGSVNTIEFLIYFTLIVFIMFSGVDYYVAQVRYSIVEQMKEQAVDKMRILGWLPESEQDEIVSRLTDMGYTDIELEGTLEGEGKVSRPVTRNVANAELSTVSLTITAKPKEKPFLFGRLVGAEEDGEFVIRVRGEALSERPSFD